jgi:riboflavin biosynthesis pyrimidine reductase
VVTLGSTDTHSADEGKVRLRRVVPEGPDVNPEEAYAVPSGTPWLRANMVCSADGAITGPDHKSAGVSSPADRYVFSALRRLCDVVLVGAGTARAEGYRPARVPIALVSARLDLELSSPLLAQADPRTIVYTAASAGAEQIAATSAVADLVLCGESQVDLGFAVDDLHRRGLLHVLCEGGPTLLRTVLGDGLLDELCLTISPVLVGGTIARIVAGAPLPGLVDLELAHLLEADGSLFARYLVRRD